MIGDSPSWRKGYVTGKKTTDSKRGYTEQITNTGKRKDRDCKECSSHPSCSDPVTQRARKKCAQRSHHEAKMSAVHLSLRTKRGGTK